MTHRAYADVALAPDPASAFVQEFLENPNNSELTIVGVSDALIPNLHYRKANGGLRYV